MSTAKRVLVVEDDSAIRLIEERILEAAGFEVTGVADGFQGIAAVQTQSFDLFVVDVMMPGMSGFDFARELRRNAKTRLTPLLFVTARADEASITEGFNVGAALYLVKPFTTATLLTMVRGALATAQATIPPAKAAIPV